MSQKFAPFLLTNVLPIRYRPGKSTSEQIFTMDCTFTRWGAQCCEITKIVLQVDTPKIFVFHRMFILYIEKIPWQERTVRYDSLVEKNVVS